MNGGRSVVRLAAAALALVVPAATVRAAPTAAASGNALIIYPVTVIKTKDMDFGNVASTIAGTAVIDPNADSISEPAA